MKTRPTLVDVARIAGVSKTTASLVLNGKGNSNIPEATRQRVFDAARSLQFRPNGVARALTKQRADVLGVVCTISPFIRRSVHAFEHGLLSAIFSQALQCGYNPMVYGYPGDAASVKELDRYADGRSDAFILINPSPDCLLIGHLREAGIPVVTMCCRSKEPETLWVDSDNEAGIRAAVKHLAALGHRHIGYLTGPRREYDCISRVAAFQETLERLGLPVREDLIVPYLWKVGVTEEVLGRFVACEKPATAVLAWNDFVAEDLYRTASQLGLRIPEDLSVIGFDDTPSAPVTSPPLTTIRQDLDQMGRAAVELAVDRIAGSDRNQNVNCAVCPVELLVRQSTAPPRVKEVTATI